MRKEQDKKPNFIKDLNAGILDELTKGGKIKNAVGLAGEVKELTAVTNICGLPFCGYLGKIETPRPSGIMDEIVIAFEEAAVKRDKTGDGLRLHEYFTVGSRLLVAGKMQTLKDFESGRVLVYVLAEFVALSPKAMQQDDVALVGELAYKPVHRVTPRGKHIADMFVKVQNVLTAGTCYIPCICWQETADEVAGWQQGDKVKLLGRYQSREYSKLKDIDNEESRETRTAYELSVNYIERVGEEKDAE